MNEEFAQWYHKRVGIALEEAKRAGVYDLKIMQEAFEAGYNYGYEVGMCPRNGKLSDDAS